MAGLNSWLPPDVTYALGWALIHSLWQCLGLAALAAILMAFSRHPSIRYLVATAALVAMLAAPVATFLNLLKPATPAHILLPAGSSPRFFAAPASVNFHGAAPVTVGGAPPAVNHRAAIALVSPKQFLPSRFLLPDFLPSNIIPWLVGAWLCGVALFSLRLAGGFLLLEFKHPGQFSVPNPRILALCQELQRQLGLNRAIRYLECAWLQTPAVIGWLRPVILLPVSALTGLSEMQLCAVIAHELAHIRRLDSFVNLLQMLVETLLFYHPAIWWLNKRIRAERELCCDEIAVSLTGGRLEYAKVLTLMAEWEKAPILAMAANRGPLSQRIFHILGRKPSTAKQRVLALTGGILSFAAALGGAHTLFGVAHPVPGVHAKTSLKLALSSKRIDPIAGQGPRIDEPAAKDVLPQNSGRDAAAQNPAAPDQAEVMASNRTGRLLVRRQAGRLVASSPDLSRLLLTETALTPISVASDNLSAAPVLHAQNNPPAGAQTTARPKTPICTKPSVVDSADLQDVSDSDLRTVPVAINDSPRRFLLDIGTNATKVSQAMVADLALPTADNPIDPMMANSSKGDLGAFTDVNYSPSATLFDVKGSRSTGDYRSHVRIASFTLGDATGHNLAFVVAKDSELGKSKPYDGLMTGDFFRQYDVELDFAQNKLNYLTPTSCTDPDQVAYWPHATVAVIPMTNWDGKIQVEVSIQGQVIPAVIDTASPHTVMRRDIAELMLGLKADTPDMAPDGDVRDGVGMQVYRHIFAQISFAGGVTAYNVPALVQTNSMTHNLNRTPVLGSRAQFITDPRQRIPGLTLGMDVLHQLHLYVVHGQQRLYVTAAG